MSSPFQKQFTAKTPFSVEGNPTEEKLGRETGSTKVTGDVFEGKTTTTTYNQPVVKTDAGDKAYAALSANDKKAQDKKYLSNRTRQKSIKTTGLKPLTTPGLTAELPSSKKIKNRVDPIEKVKYTIAHGKTYGNTGSHASTGYTDAEGAGSMIKSSKTRGSTVIQGVRKSGELTNIFSQQNKSMEGKGISEGMTTVKEDIVAKKNRTFYADKRKKTQAEIKRKREVKKQKLVQKK